MRHASKCLEIVVVETGLSVNASKRLAIISFNVAVGFSSTKIEQMLMHFIGDDMRTSPLLGNVWRLPMRLKIKII